MTSIRLCPDDPAYPAALRELATARTPEPPTLFLRGDLPTRLGVAIVGTRVASTGALAFTRALAADLGKAGLAIWSGGARGIDAAAHEGALDAGAPTVLVAGGGLAHPYPPEHAPLFHRVLARGGALLARVPDDARPMPHHFLQRNALLAALTAATIVVEAGIESGARSTSAIARKLGRAVLVVPSAPWEPRGAGCLAELDLGAQPITDASHVLAALGRAHPDPSASRASSPRTSSSRAHPPARAPARAPAPMTPALPGLEGLRGSLRAGPSLVDPARFTADEQAILDALDAGATHVDEVCDRTGLGFSRVAAALLTLTLHAVVVEGPAGSFWRTPH
ncbi:DNA-processing protein DprA [Chondromyces apiculatus]|uniref:Rossmann fold nucleotide-binding protein Smf possibly involved in DNA uptake n=1 Tax=Chondromyces apiculatus DSM 436 TaxID=1192034 RepID=A0A017STQ3_9BACT|nr:DNA-processing protein DprA [Chondromyces apiculatus]EYF00137.1 Rossmann fold nucleotide-binding protein Smf possibly involved in DNA uptake [Chondromyces apiculatus DSM 436]